MSKKPREVKMKDLKPRKRKRPQPIIETRTNPVTGKPYRHVVTVVPGRWNWDKDGDSYSKV